MHSQWPMQSCRLMQIKIVVIQKTDYRTFKIDELFIYLFLLFNICIFCICHFSVNKTVCVWWQDARLIENLQGQRLRWQDVAVKLRWRQTAECDIMQRRHTNVTTAVKVENWRRQNECIKRMDGGVPNAMRIDDEETLLEAESGAPADDRDNMH